MKKEISTKTKTSIENETVYTNIRLEDSKLKTSVVTYCYEITKSYNPKKATKYEISSKKEISKKVEDLIFNLVPISANKLADYRRDKIPSFVLSKSGKFFWTKIPKDISLYSSKLLGAHKCSEAKHECRRLSAASDELGGCAKVRNHATGIENYPWIVLGYETFATANDSFVVVDCKHYELCSPKKMVSAEKRMRAKLGIYQYVWEDVNSIEEGRRKYSSSSTRR